MRHKRILRLFAAVVPMLAVACGGESGMMTGPSGTSGAGTMLLSV